MKILWVHTFPPGEVSGIFMKRQLRALSDSGIHVDVKYLGKIYDPFVFCRSLVEIRRLAPKYDLIHAQYGSGCGYLVSKVDAPKIVTLRGSDLYGWESFRFRDRFREFISRRMTTVSLRRFSLIIVVSHRMKRMLSNPLQKKTVVIPDGVDFDEFFPISREEARRILKRKDHDRKCILYYPGLPGRACVKRPSLARAVVDVVRKYIPGVELMEVTNIAPERMNVVINACDVVLLTSTHEGWPNIVKESMACNIPFVSTNVSDLKEVAENSPGCFVAETDTVEELAKGILRAFEVLQRYGRQDLRRNINFLCKRYTVDCLKQIYHVILNQENSVTN